MTIKELYKELKGLGLPVAYHHFDVNHEVPKLPYIIYFVDGRYDYIADNINYVIKQSVEIELYTKTVDYDAIDALEELLREHDLAFRCIPFSWIETEGFYMTSYNIII